MVTKVMDHIADSVADAFMLRSRHRRSSQQLLREIQEVRRLSRYHRERYLHDVQRRRQRAVSPQEVEIAVRRALRDEEISGQ